MSETMAPVQYRNDPYFGLDYYEEKFGSWFFGREAEGGKIITNLRAARLTLLHAESGVGKSSLLRAGVAWRMHKLADDSFARRGTARFVPIVFSSWKDDPVTELTGTIRAAIGPYLTENPGPELPADRLDAAIAGASKAANTSLLIMLDQFEEYFLYRSREPVPERFADQLACCINRTDLRAHFLIAIREDAYGGLGDLFKGRIANIYSNYLHVEYLDRACAEQAIREPLEIYNGQPGVSEPVHIQDQLVDAVLDQVRAFDDDDGAAQRQGASNGGGRNRVVTPMLQLVMETVWQRERAQGSHELRLSTLQDLHGVRMMADAHLEKALSTLDSGDHRGGERQTAIDIFDHLVSPSGGKIAESVPDLAKRTGHSETQVSTVLDKLDHERIVRSVPAAPGQDPMRYRRYEIFHDVLVPPINRAMAPKTLASVQDAVVVARQAEEKAPNPVPKKLSAWWHWHWHWHWSLPVSSVAAACGAVAAAIAVIAVQQLAQPAAALAVAKFSLRPVSDNAAGSVIVHESPNGYTLDAALKNLPPLKGNEYYECWYLRSPQGPPSDAITGGSFTAATSNETFTMTSAADPSRYKIMEIAIQHPGDSGRPGTVILRGTGEKT